MQVVNVNNKPIWFLLWNKSISFSWVETYGWSDNVHKTRIELKFHRWMDHILYPNKNLPCIKVANGVNKLSVKTYFICSFLKFEKCVYKKTHARVMKFLKSL